MMLSEMEKHMEAFRGILPEVALPLSVSQMQDEEPRNKMQQAVSKVIKLNQLKMVRCPVLVQLRRAWDPVQYSLPRVACLRDPEGITGWAEPKCGWEGVGGYPRKAEASVCLVS